MFDEHYLDKFKAAGLLDTTGGELQHLISDAATMQIIRWTGGGFGMAAHNYDGARNAASADVAIGLALLIPLPRLLPPPLPPPPPISHQL